MKHYRNKKAGAILAETTSFFLKPSNKKMFGVSHNDTNTNTSKYRSDQLNKIMPVVGKYSNWIRTIANNPHSLTHELSNLGLHSNNSHNVSQAVNPTLFNFGYWLAVYRVDKPQKSWRWVLVTVEQALKLPIHKRTRDRIEALIAEKREAANDE